MTHQTDIMEGRFWRNQGLKEVIGLWLEHMADPVHGAFHMNFDREWQPIESDRKIPWVIARHVFGLCAGYMLFGEQKYLEMARRGVDYLVQHAWDREFGGWYNSLNLDGSPAETAKGGFNQMYVTTGLTFYYFVTHDSEVLHYVEKSNRIFEDHAWDTEHQGYFDLLDRNLEVADERKHFGSQIVMLSGHPLYLYLATQQREYLAQIEKTMAVIRQHVFDPATGSVLELFDRQWHYIGSPRSDGTEVDIGHCIEAAWTSLRLYDLVGDKELLEFGIRMAERATRWGFNPDNGAWYISIGKDNPKQRAKTSSWWVQAYGNFIQLYMYHITGDPKHLEAFQKTAGFWNDHFIDKQFGGIFGSVYTDGTVEQSAKGLGKTSYHTMEHSLLVSLYLDLFVNQEPAELYFCVSSSESITRHYVCPVEAQAVKLAGVTVDGKRWGAYNSDSRYVILPPGEQMKVKATLAVSPELRPHVTQTELPLIRATYEGNVLELEVRPGAEGGRIWIKHPASDFSVEQQGQNSVQVRGGKMSAKALESIYDSQDKILALRLPAGEKPVKLRVVQ